MRKNADSAIDDLRLEATAAVLRELAMKRSIWIAGWKAVIAVSLFLGVSAAGVRAQETSCRNSMLKGDYAFTVSGQVFMPVKGMDGTVTTVGGWPSEGAILRPATPMVSA